MIRVVLEELLPVQRHHAPTLNQDIEVPILDDGGNLTDFHMQLEYIQYRFDVA